MHLFCDELDDHTHNYLPSACRWDGLNTIAVSAGADTDRVVRDTSRVRPVRRAAESGRRHRHRSRIRSLSAGALTIQHGDVSSVQFTSIRPGLRVHRLREDGDRPNRMDVRGCEVAVRRSS